MKVYILFKRSRHEEEDNVEVLSVHKTPPKDQEKHIPGDATHYAVQIYYEEFELVE